MTWRQLVRIDDIDICSFLNGGSVMPFIKLVIENIQKKFPTLPKKCPMKPQDFLFENVTITEPGDDSRISIEKAMSSNPFPNGIYRL